MNDDERMNQFALLLVNSPVGCKIELDNYPTNQGGPSHHYVLPSILYACESDVCGDSIIFDCTNSWHTSVNHIFLIYKCRHCKQTTVVFAISKTITLTSLEQKITFKKIGQEPRYRQKIPSAVLRELSEQSDRELLQKANELEQQNFGIGAFVYYRRVVENQKNTLIDLIVSVLETEGADQQKIDQLKAEKERISFSESVDNFKEYIPRSLYLHGHNPMTILHKSLSMGVHQYDEEKCMELASAIREVLCVMVSRIRELKKDNKSLRDALAKILK